MSESRYCFCLWQSNRHVHGHHAVDEYGSASESKESARKELNPVGTSVRQMTC